MAEFAKRSEVTIETMVSLVFGFACHFQLWTGIISVVFVAVIIVIMITLSGAGEVPY